MEDEIYKICKKYMNKHQGGDLPMKKKKSKLVLLHLSDINDDTVKLKNINGKEYLTDKLTLVNELLPSKEKSESDDEEVKIGGMKNISFDRVDDNFVYFKNGKYAASKDELISGLSQYDNGKYNPVDVNIVKIKESRKKRPQSAKQKEWLDFVNTLGKNPKYEGLSRQALMKIASEKRKKMKK